jgi:hypothetical protein
MTRLHTAENGLELIERIVYVDGDACERPHGLGSCVVLGFRHLPRYTGASIVQVLVRDLTPVLLIAHPSLLRKNEYELPILRNTDFLALVLQSIA